LGLVSISFTFYEWFKLTISDRLENDFYGIAKHYSQTMMIWGFFFFLIVVTALWFAKKKYSQLNVTIVFFCTSNYVLGSTSIRWRTDRSIKVIK